MRQKNHVESAGGGVTGTESPSPSTHAHTQETKPKTDKIYDTVVFRILVIRQERTVILRDQEQISPVMTPVTALGKLWGHHTGNGDRRGTPKSLGAEEMKLGAQGDEGTRDYRTEYQKEENETVVIDRGVGPRHTRPSKRTAGAMPRASPTAHSRLQGHRCVHADSLMVTASPSGGAVVCAGGCVWGYRRCAFCSVLL